MKHLILSCYAFVVKEWAKLQLKIHIPSKLYWLLISITVSLWSGFGSALSFAPYSGKQFHLKRGDLVMNGYRPCWFLRTISYKQMRLAPVSYKNSGLKLLFTFQVWARLFCRSMYFFCFRIFVLIVWMCPTPYWTISNTFVKRNSNIILIIQTGNLKFASGNYISPVGRQKAT